MADRTGSGPRSGGHTHDWENIVVFVYGDRIERVAPSSHGNYHGATSNPVLNGTHPLVVYHKDGRGTHCFRMARFSEGLTPENDYKHWQVSDLVGWNGFPHGLRDKLAKAKFGKATFKLIDSRFGDTLKKAAGDRVPGFNPYGET
ncbi:hypothetical protein IL306_009904 [Fusarium sp. DS 682]|nr:hypothetical protein IL306_009904 [Fusarium sp. DS 682]